MDDRRLESYLKTAGATRANQLWYGGATTAGALRGVRYEQALWTPPGLVNGIWRLVLHMAYWEYIVRRTLSGKGERGGFARPGSDFPPLPDAPNQEAWKADVALIKQERTRLVRALEGFDPARLDEVPPSRSNWTYARLIEGVLMHDVHHTAQIQILKRLWQAAQGQGPA
jgi:hypothetical protein